MLKKGKTVLAAGGLTVLLLVCGCGQKRIETTEVPREPEVREKTGAVKAASAHYFVERHDCLWTIAGQPRVYGDPFQWPQLFKTNRDQIKDPDLIYPRQDLRVEKGMSIEEVDHVRKVAMATPKYIPHSKPRETLPLDYF